jgi:hypothetical protein
MNRPRPLHDYPATTLDGLQSAITALLLGYQDMLPTDLSVKLDIFRYDVSQAISLGSQQARAFTPHPVTTARPLLSGPGPQHPQRRLDQPRAPRSGPYQERRPR